MPRRQPFTTLCQVLARSSRADLHVHTTCSDGTYTPAQVVELARRGFKARRLVDGYPEWKRAGLPVAAGKGG